MAIIHSVSVRSINETHSTRLRPASLTALVVGSMIGGGGIPALALREPQLDAGLNYLLMAALLYAPGILFYWWARNARAEKTFTGMEALIALAIGTAAALAAYLMWTGAISPI